MFEHLGLFRLRQTSLDRLSTKSKMLLLSLSDEVAMVKNGKTEIAEPPLWRLGAVAPRQKG